MIIKKYALFSVCCFMLFTSGSALAWHRIVPGVDVPPSAATPPEIAVPPELSQEENPADAPQLEVEPVV